MSSTFQKRGLSPESPKGSEPRPPPASGHTCTETEPLLRQQSPRLSPLPCRREGCTPPRRVGPTRTVARGGRRQCWVQSPGPWPQPQQRLGGPWQSQ